MPFDYSNIKGNFPLLWTTFKEALIESVKQTDISDFEKARISLPDRTRLNFEILFPKVAGMMDLKFAEEMKFRVDGTMYVEGSRNTKIPIVLIESENDCTSTHDEIYKLCWLNSPLKVLLICHPWNEISKIELTEGYWDYIIEDFAEDNVLTGYFAMIVAEWDDDGLLKYYTHVYDENGKKLDNEDGILIEVKPPTNK